MDEIGSYFSIFSAMTIGGIFWMGMNWEKRHQELVKLQHTSATETIEDYYQANRSCSQGWFRHHIGAHDWVFSQFNSIIEVIGLVVFLFGIAICLLSLAPRSIAKQIETKYSIMVEVFHKTRESKKYCSLDVVWHKFTMDFHDQSWFVDCHLHHAYSFDYDARVSWCMFSLHLKKIG